MTVVGDAWWTTDAGPEIEPSQLDTNDVYEPQPFSTMLIHSVHQC